jgi:putative FmdB family regulatory protein
MPIYEYECRKCGHVFDALQKMSDPPHTDCPDCGQPELRKLLSAPNFRLKGGGWYETDFKDKNKRNLADSGDAGSSTPKSDAGDARGHDKGNGKDKDKGKASGSADSKPKATKAGGSAPASGKAD